MSVDFRKRAAHAEPVLLRHVALCDADEAGEPGFGSEQIVVRVVSFRGRDVVADGEQLALHVEQD
jgi:hypothetical protein